MTCFKRWRFPAALPQTSNAFQHVDCVPERQRHLEHLACIEMVWATLTQESPEELNAEKISMSTYDSQGATACLLQARWNPFDRSRVGRAGLQHRALDFGPENPLRFLVCIPALPTHGCLLQSIYSLWNMEVRMAPCGLVQGKCILRWVTPLWSKRLGGIPSTACAWSPL